MKTGSWSGVSVSCTKRAKRANDDEKDVNDGLGLGFRVRVRVIMIMTVCTERKTLTYDVLYKMYLYIPTNKKSFKSLYWAYIWLIVNDKHEILRIVNIDL